jgi:hypothetical protein
MLEREDVEQTEGFELGSVSHHGEIEVLGFHQLLQPLEVFLFSVVYHL